MNGVETDADLPRFVAETMHHPTRRFFDFKKNQIQLFSDGSLSTDDIHPLAKSHSMNVNVRYSTIQYFFPIEKFSLLYRSIVVTSLALAMFFYAEFLKWSDRIYEIGFTESSLNANAGLPFLLPLFGWMLLDYLVTETGTPERIVIKTRDNEKIELRGQLPLQDIITISRGVVVVGLLSGIVLAAPDESFILMISSLIFFGLLFALLFRGVKWFVSDSFSLKSPSLKLIQFYFALVAIKDEHNTLSVPHSKVEETELSEIKSKLEKFTQILQPVEASRDIFSSTSPTFIVIAIGATTEKLMHIACDDLGISRKKNARPTLNSYVSEYQTKQRLELKVLHQLDLIKNFRNRAAHQFNIEWDESLIVLNEFCKFVEWYAQHHQKNLANVEKVQAHSETIS